MLRRCSARFCAAAPGAAGTAATPAGTIANAKIPKGRPEMLSWFRAGVMWRRPASYKNPWGLGIESPTHGTPMNDHALLHCVDNTNVKHIRALKQTSERAHHTRVLPVVTHRVAVMRFKSGREPLNRQQLQPGTVYWAVMFSRRAHKRRASGLITMFDRTTGILLNDKFQPLGTRVMYVAGRHVNHRYHLKAAVLANFFV